jgi:predicted nucleotidyltransferase
MQSQLVTHIISHLQHIKGISAIALGGSRARGTHTEKSDVDVGIYYEAEGSLDLAELSRVATELDDNHRENLITPIGGWGKWINGGGWLCVDGVAVDFLYRDLARVRQVIADNHAGKITIDYQPGHPHGFVSSIYMGEIAICQPLYDPFGVISDLKVQTSPYPVALRQATIDTFAWEITFSLLVGAKAVTRGDVAYAAGCCFRSVACMNQVLFALNGEYLLNEKGALALAETFNIHLQDYKRRIESAFEMLSTDEESIIGALQILNELEQELRELYFIKQKLC